MRKAEMLSNKIASTHSGLDILIVLSLIKKLIELLKICNLSNEKIHYRLKRIKSSFAWKRILRRIIKESGQKNEELYFNSFIEEADKLTLEDIEQLIKEEV